MDAADAKNGAATSSIGLFIRARRKERDLTQRQLAMYARVSFSVVNRVENGDLNVRLESLNRLLGVFGYELTPTAAPRVDDLSTNDVDSTDESDSDYEKLVEL